MILIFLLPTLIGHNGRKVFRVVVLSSFKYFFVFADLRVEQGNEWVERSPSISHPESWKEPRPLCLTTERIVLTIPGKYSKYSSIFFSVRRRDVFLRQVDWPIHRMTSLLVPAPASYFFVFPSNWTDVFFSRTNPFFATLSRAWWSLKSFGT